MGFMKKAKLTSPFLTPQHGWNYRETMTTSRMDIAARG